MRLIDADALMEVYARHEFCSDMGDAIEILANFPTVDAEPVRHGYWRNYKDEHTCSCCGETVTGNWYDQDNDAYWFCPWCCAKMDAERKEE